MLLTIILHLVGFVAGAPLPAPAEEVVTPRAAQVRLAELLGSAASIDSITPDGSTITFAITVGDRALDVAARTDKRGGVIALEITEANRPLAPGETGPLTYLAPELLEATAVVQLTVDEDQAVTIGTNDGRRYMVIPGRGSGGPNRAATNTAVESRWAAAWNHRS